MPDFRIRRGAVHPAELVRDHPLLGLRRQLPGDGRGLRCGGLRRGFGGLGLPRGSLCVRLGPRGLGLGGGRLRRQRRVRKPRAGVRGGRGARLRRGLRGGRSLCFVLTS